MASGFIEADVSSTVTLSAIHGSTGASASAYAGTWGAISATSGIPLTQSSSLGSTIALPSGGVRWSHLELIIKDSASTNPIDHSVKILLTWDVDGTHICGGPSDSAEMVLTRPSSATTFMVGVDLDMQPAIPSQGTANTVYLWISGTYFNDSTPELERARLYWHEIF